MNHRTAQPLHCTRPPCRPGASATCRARSDPGRSDDHAHGVVRNGRSAHTADAALLSAPPRRAGSTVKTLAPPEDMHDGNNTPCSNRADTRSRQSGRQLMSESSTEMRYPSHEGAIPGGIRPNTPRSGWEGNGRNQPLTCDGTARDEIADAGAELTQSGTRRDMRLFIGI